ncbi:hypothetical protein CC1G_03359 [Coprinopsis cinerea okayama7|uniref:Uncharacterized protein n=1 Tax=Coprinopsis cinerea (strain Okayama-7 / 130 / ATCC MYA-4618 / FGSC 9003) TaxID=240176 RepID=A8NQY5_COPC7|nr:hypothetical protein CC1G_03359 [Coprinopsis cinerea okayama7\|eukprot:XP_001835577.1 hypothetical protein CC1G_03359 [Coprinopsis cinerea okayama7\
MPIHLCNDGDIQGLMSLANKRPASEAANPAVSSSSNLCISTQVGLGPMNSSIHRLPAELILDIFDLACQTEWEDQLLANQVKLPSAPFVLGQVCRHWRHLTQTTPSLWTRLSLVLSGEKGQTPISFLHYYLSRSKNSLLSIHIQQDRTRMFNLFEHDAYQRAFTQVIDILAPHSERWKDVSLYVPGCHPCPSLQSIQGRLPNLESLSIRMSSVRLSLRLRPSELNMFNHAPRLQKVQYPDVSDRLRLHIDYSTLTSFTCDNIAFADAVEILRGSANLVHCTLAVLYYTQVNLDVPTITLPKLKTLTLREHCRFVQCPLLRVLVLPNLRVLNTDRRSSTDQPIKALLDRSGCTPVVHLMDRRGGSLIGRRRMQALVSNAILQPYSIGLE